MNKQLKQVKDFNKAFNLPMNLETPKQSLIDLGASLLEEELDELWEAVNIYNHKDKDKGIIAYFDALIDLQYVLLGRYLLHGIEYTYVNKYDNISGFELEYRDIRNHYDTMYTYISNYKQGVFSIKHNLDTIANSIYYLLSQSGLLDYFDKGFTEVHASNMSKLDENNKPIFREDGKVMKSENYFKPNLKDILCK